MFEDGIGQDTSGYYKTFVHAFLNTSSLCERVCDEMTKGNAIEGDFGNTEPEDVHERRSTENMNETLKAKPNEYIFDGCCNGRETTENEEIIVCAGRSIPKEQDTIHYAEILKRDPCSESLKRDPCSERKKLPTRRTRDSLNPILRHHDTDALGVVDSEDINNRPKIIATQDDFALYANMRGSKFVREHHGRSLESEQGSHRRVQCSRSDSEIVYQNTSDDFRDGPSHIYENFEDKMKSRRGGLRSSSSFKSTTSNDTSETESLYEDLDDVVYEAMSPPPQRSVSKPIDIVYTSIDFSGRKSQSPLSVGSCTNSSSLGSLDRTELRRCTSYSNVGTPRAFPTGGKPPELPQRDSGSFVKRRRPRSLHLGSQNSMTNFGLGLYTGTLVGCCIVSKTSPKSVQKIIGDYLAREKKEHSKPVSLNVTSEILRLSLNCAPWNLLAENSVDDIGCVKTFSANNKTALGYTISKPGEDTRLFVIHCSDADQIKEAIVKNFKRPETCANSVSRWSSMMALGTPRPRQSRSLPRMGSLSRSSQKNELASFDELVYLGSHKVKKSFLVVNDNISSVLDHRDSKDYTVAKIELYRDAIHLKDSREDRLLDIHQLEWILSMGLFDEDRRYFGYISSKAFQGSKTRTSCHVFRCNRVGLASQIMETIRQACQATYLARTSDLPPDFRSRTNSNSSSSSEGSMSSNSETMSIASTNSSPPEVDWSQTLPARGRRRPGFLAKRLGRKCMTIIQSFTEEDTDTGNDTLGEETPTKRIPEEKPHPVKCPQDEKAQPANCVPEKDARPPQSITEEKPHSEKRTPEEQPQPPKCATKLKHHKETSEKRFNVFYLVSAIVSPPLKSKHVKECLKQYQKSVDKAMKKSTDNGQQYKKAELVLSPKGVMILDDHTQTPQAFYERATISGVQSHPDGKCAFAFTTLVSGNTKHKCHLFLQDKDPIGPIIQELQTYIS